MQRPPPPPPPPHTHTRAAANLAGVLTLRGCAGCRCVIASSAGISALTGAMATFYYLIKSNNEYRGVESSDIDAASDALGQIISDFQVLLDLANAEFSYQPRHLFAAPPPVLRLPSRCSI